MAKSEGGEKGQHGGKREQSGRPRFGEQRRVMMVVSVDQATAEAVDGASEAAGVGRGVWLDGVVAAAVAKSKGTFTVTDVLGPFGGRKPKRGEK